MGVCQVVVVEMEKSMKLEKLSKNNLININGKKIICYGCSQAYLKELSQKFPYISDNIIAVYDENNRSCAPIRFENRNFPVLTKDQLTEDTFQDAIWLILSDYFNEAYENLTLIEVIQKTLDVVYYFENYETEIEMEYRRRYQNHCLENIILFRSGPHASAYIKGMDFSDNARALFEYMLANKFNETYEFVWLVKNPTEFSQKYSQYSNVHFVAYDWSISEKIEERDVYYKVLCLSKYLFFTDAYGFARNCRKDQIRIQLWHGCGYKTRVNFVPCEKRYEYMTVISDMYANVYHKAFGLRENQMLVTGYAKQDWLFSPLIDVQRELELPNADKYIFWLPTFRMAKQGLENLNQYIFDTQTGLPIVDSFEKCKILNEILTENNTILVVKLHPFQDKSKIVNAENVSMSAMKNIVFLDNDFLYEKDIQTNQILGCADALISDYSSAAVDYMLLDRPIAFTLDDVEAYKESRGFFFENIEDWLPGKKLYTFDDFYYFIKEVCKGTDSTRTVRKGLMETMHKYHDNRNCERITAALGI